MRMSNQADPMTKITRKKFLHDAALLCAGGISAAPALTAANSGGAAVVSDPVSASNAAFRLDVTAGKRLRVRLADAGSALVLADGDYSYSFGNVAFGEAAVIQLSEVILESRLSSPHGIEVVHQFVLPRGRES